MKFCYKCGRNTPGAPRFCHSCGRSYDKKICRRFHENPRWAEACAQCGSRELSRPQPKISSGWRLLGWITTGVTGIALAFLTTILCLGTIRDTLVGRHRIGLLLLSASLCTVLWSLWTRLPFLFRQFARKSFLRSKRQSLDFLD